MKFDRRWLVAFLLCSSLIGCEVKKRGGGGAAVTASQAKTPSADVIALRDEVIAKTVILDRPEYTPKDPTLYDATIEWALYLYGRDPSKRAVVIDEAARRAAIHIASGEPGLSALEKLIAARYNAPVITRSGDVVHIDLAIIAGKPRSSRHGFAVTSTLEDRGGGLVAGEVIRNLKAGIVAEPGAKVYQVEVDIPSRYVKEWTYVYSVDEDVIRVFRKDRSDQAYMTDTLGGNLDKVRSFHWTSLRVDWLGRTFARPTDARGRVR